MKIEYVKEVIQRIAARYENEEDQKHIEIICYCIYLLDRFRKDDTERIVTRFLDMDIDHLAGLHFPKERMDDLAFVSSGMKQYLHNEKKIKYDAWYKENRDAYRVEWNRYDIPDRMEEIARLRAKGYERQIWLNFQNRALTFYYYGIYDEALTQATKRLPMMSVAELGNNMYEWIILVENRDTVSIVQDIVKEFNIGVHADLDFIWTGSNDFIRADKKDITLNFDSLPVSLYPFQREGVTAMIKFERTLQADDMGLGKTVQSIYTMHELVNSHCIIVAPPTVIYNWQMEYEKALGIKADIFNPKKKIHGKTVIVSYGLVAHLHKLTGYKGMIVDESHLIKDENTKRFKAIYEVIMTMKYRILITGTPIQKSTVDLIPQLTALGYLNQRSKSGFKIRYCSKTATTFDLNELNLRLRNMCMVRRLKSEVDIQLPPSTTTVLPVDISNREEYNMALTDIQNYLNKIKKLEPEQITRAMKAETLIRVSHLKRLAAAGCRDQIIEFVNNCLEQEKSVLIFVCSNDARKAYTEAFNTPYVIWGEVSSKQRQVLCTQFQEDPNPSVMIINIRAGAEGQNLTKASIVVHAEKDWIPAKHDQARDRTHRINQTEHVFDYFFEAKDTIDERIMEVLQHRRTIAEASTGAITANMVNMYSTVLKTEFGINFGASEEEIEEVTEM